MIAKRLTFAAGVAFTTVALLTAVNLHRVTAAPGKSPGASAFLKDVQRGNPHLKSIGRISFGPQGLLLVAEPSAAAIVAIDTGDTGPVQKLKQRIDDVSGLLAARLGAPAGDIRIIDLAVNPASGKIYFSLIRPADKQAALVTIDAAGQVSDFPLDQVAYVRVKLPSNESSQARNITDLAFAKDRVIVAGQSNEEFANKIFSIPLPLANGIAGNFYSAETYHVSHRKWETKAPIQSFIPYEENGRSYIVGAFACTPIAKFPLEGLESGSKVKGTSVVELGSGNRPLDMFTYEKGGKRWVVTNTQRFGKNLFGPSKYWGARVDMDYLAASTPDKINENAVRRDVKGPKGPGGIEVVDALFGAVQVSRLNNDEIVVLREGQDKLALEMARLP